VAASASLHEVTKGNLGLVDWASAHVLHMNGVWQFVVCLAVAGLSLLAARALCARVARLTSGRPLLEQWVRHRLAAFLAPLFDLLLLQMILGFTAARIWPMSVLELGARFAEAWLVIQLFAAVILPPGWTKVVTLAVGGGFVLDVFGILEPLIRYLDSLAMTLGDQRVSALEVIKAMAVLGVLLPVINRLCAFLEAGFERLPEMKPGVRVLLAKLVKVALYAVALVSAMDLVGINVQMVAVFSGAVGLGIGIGLQKVVSNLLSGVILLLDNSIKPGDVIEVGGVYGWVETMNARFTSMLTRDGKSYLIPNDELVTGKVVNWSYSGPSVRLKIPVTVAYSADLKLAMELMLQAVTGKDRVLDNPKPAVLLKGFEDNGMALELRVWMVHPERGVASVASAILLSVYEFFGQNGIEFPFPQRELHFAGPLDVKVDRGEGG
jgi:small-conductance mechanosensitive channel